MLIIWILGEQQSTHNERTQLFLNLEWHALNKMPKHVNNQIKHSNKETKRFNKILSEIKQLNKVRKGLILFNSFQPSNNNYAPTVAKNSFSKGTKRCNSETTRLTDGRRVSKNILTGTWEHLGCVAYRSTLCSRRDNKCSCCMQRYVRGEMFAANSILPSLPTFE